MKPPDFVALICRKGHVAVGSLGSGSSHETEFCEECGESTISGCDECDWPIRGFGPQQWMAGPYDKPKFCGKCGSPYPWTRDILAETDKFTDTITSLTEEEKQDVKKTVKSTRCSEAPFLNWTTGSHFPFRPRAMNSETGGIGL
jgi:hypothetical protein